MITSSMLERMDRTREVGDWEVGVGHGAKLGAHQSLQLSERLAAHEGAPHQVAAVVPRMERLHLLVGDQAPLLHT